MQRVAKKATAIVATAAAVGFSSLFLAAAPATAAPVTCGNGATMLTGGICELTVTATGPTVFTPTAEVSQLEALLVAGGGSGTYAAQSYGAGGGGEVKVVGFADTVTPIDLTVGAANTDTTAIQGSATGTAVAGINATQSAVYSGGASGNGNPGFAGSAGATGAGGGAGGPAPDQTTGGVGATAASVAPAGSLFSNDTTCYGGGGASATTPTTAGVASCGGGFVTLAGSDFVATAPTPNSGGGGSAGSTNASVATAGASGVVVLRWVAVGATVTFDTAGRGTAVAPETVAFGTTVTQPADPTAAGFTFDGWFTDAAFTTRVDFSAPVSASTTYYASFTPVPVASVSVSFNTGGRGAAIAPQTVASGSTVTRPADPVAAGFTFNGWFGDAAFTTPVDFTAAVTASATYYASFTAVAAPAPALPTPAQPAVIAPAAPVAPVVSTPAPATRALAVTGGTVDTTALAAGLAALAAGAGLLVVAARRTRRVR
jgi:uncharacterized repeat protein (TIGR02543 family)